MSRRASPAPRRTVAIKRTDGHPLDRADVQYDLLYSIFSDTHNVFTNPYPESHSDTTKLCFRDLYVKTILHSPKATKALRDKISDSHAFATDFAMLALLVNVGRINTTMSFFPEMKTAIRTYHPIPAFQKTNGNLQDAPRIKHVLKTCLLDAETKNPPSTPADVLSRVKAGQAPSTSVMNLIFVLANHSGPVGQAHFTENLDFVDLFLRRDISSETRARAFLWLCYHYLESSSVVSDDDYDNDGAINPFADPRREKAPAFVMLTEAEILLENVDPEDEKALGEKLVEQRNRILNNQGAKESNKLTGKSSAAEATIADEDEEDAASGNEVHSKGKRGGTIRTKSTVAAKEKKAASDKLRRDRLKQKAKDRTIFTPIKSIASDDEYDSATETSMLPPMQNQYPHHQYQYQPPLPATRSQPIYQPQQSLPLPATRSQPMYRRISSVTPEPASAHPRRYSPYPRSPDQVTASIQRNSRGHQYSRSTLRVPQRTMLQHAWHVITTSDPLLDSDEEMGDEHVRHDYVQRLQIITRLRGKAPTPELDQLSMEVRT